MPNDEGMTKCRIPNQIRVIPSGAKRSRGCNAADEVREARLSIPLQCPPLTLGDPSTPLRMTIRHSGFVIHSTFVIRHSSFAIRHF